MKEYFDKVLCTEELPTEGIYTTNISEKTKFSNNDWYLGYQLVFPKWFMKPVSLDEVRAW